jgi:hypothetical protein
MARKPWLATYKKRECLEHARIGTISQNLSTIHSNPIILFRSNIALKTLHLTQHKEVHSFIYYSIQRTKTNQQPIMALSADATTIADLLAALTHPDTNAIRQAEVALKPLLKRPECVPVLVEVIKGRETLVSFDLCSLCCLCCSTGHRLVHSHQLFVHVICSTHDPAPTLQPFPTKEH